MHLESRRVQRVHLPQPLGARLGATPVTLVDVSILGARIEHRTPLIAGAFSRLAFRWDEQEIRATVRIVRSRLERFAPGVDGMTVYHSGLEFERIAEEHRARLRQMIETFITRALEEQKLNARGVMPLHDVSAMPIFRFGGQLTNDGADSGYVSYSLENRAWRMKRTHDPGQPLDGFTISAREEHLQAELLCRAYEKSDGEGRRMIQLFAQLSIADGGAVSRGRFEP